MNYRPGFCLGRRRVPSAILTEAWSLGIIPDFVYLPLFHARPAGRLSIAELLPSCDSPTTFDATNTILCVTRCLPPLRAQGHVLVDFVVERRLDLDITIDS